MPIVGFGLTKIHAEKNTAIKGKVDIKNNVMIKELKEADISLGKEKGTAIKFIFEFSSIYEPKIGKMLFEGEVLFMDSAEKIKSIDESWKKEKKVPQDVMGAVLNNVLNKCTIHALILSQDINLPSPIQLPKVGIGKPEAKASAKK